MDREWHIFEDRQSAVLTTRILDAAKRRDLESEFSRVGWTTIVAVCCTDEEWLELAREANPPEWRTRAELSRDH